MKYIRSIIYPNSFFFILSFLFRANYPELLTFVPRLSTLRLADVEMTSLPTIPLKILTQLDLSGNRLADLPFLSAEGVPNLRHLNLSRNQVIRLTNFNNVFGCLQLCKSMKISTQSD